MTSTDRKKVRNLIATEFLANWAIKTQLVQLYTKLLFTVFISKIKTIVLKTNGTISNSLEPSFIQKSAEEDTHSGIESFTLIF